MSCDGMSWQDCATKTKQAIQQAATAEEALSAFDDWAASYRSLYEAQGDAAITPNDLDRIESYVEEHIDGLTDPVDIALDAAIERYFPRIAAMLAWASGPVVQFLWTSLVPSPIATALQEAQLVNEELGELVHQKFQARLRADWQSEYDNAVLHAPKPGPVPLP